MIVRTRKGLWFLNLKYTLFIFSGCIVYNTINYFQDSGIKGVPCDDNVSGVGRWERYKSQTAGATGNKNECSKVDKGKPLGTTYEKYDILSYIINL